MRRTTSRFVPRIETFELRLLQANGLYTYFQGAGTSILMDTSDTTNHSAWEFPGMLVTIDTYINQNAGTGIQSVTYNFGSEALYLGTTTYSPSLGQAGPMSAETHTISGSRNTTGDEVKFYLPKDPGDVTITVTVVPYAYYGGTNPAVTDTLIVHNQAPTVNYFTLADRSSQTTKAAGKMIGGSRPATSDYAIEYPGVGFWASVTNSTHYSLNLGFIQVIDSIHYAYSYTNGTANDATGTELLDSGSNNAIWYFGRANSINSGDTKQLGDPSSKEAGTGGYAEREHAGDIY